MPDRGVDSDLRDLVGADLDSVHGPHPRWSRSPAARRLGLGAAPPSGAVTPAAAIVTAVVALAVILAVVILPSGNQAAPGILATAARSIEPLPSSVSPSATATIGEVPMGRVAVSTQGGVPALAVRAVLLPSPAGQAVVRIDIRVVGPMTDAIGVGRFVVIHDGQRDSLPTAQGGTPDPLALAAGIGAGATVYAEFEIPVTDDEWADLGFLGTADYVSFTYPLHRPAAVASALTAACPGLAEWAAASLIPSATPEVKPSFEPIDPATKPTTGLIEPGTVGVLPAPDGAAGALVRVSNARFCDRFPDVRPDAIEFDPDASLLLADVDISVLESGSLDHWLPGGEGGISAVYRGWAQLGGPEPPVWFPGFNWVNSIASGAGFTYHGTMAWAVPGGDGQVTIAVRGAATGSDAPQFSYLVRPGTVAGGPIVSQPAQTPLPTLTADRSALPVDVPAVVPVGGARVQALVGSVQQVPRYTGVVPATAGDVFLEFSYRTTGATTEYTWEPSEWLVVGPGGSVARQLWRSPYESPTDGRPHFIAFDTPVPQLAELNAPLFLVAEVPAAGRVALEYRPSGGTAAATWVLREE